MVGAGSNFEGVFSIGEVGQAHDGSLGTAHAYIDALSEVGADVVKFQIHIAEAESHPSEPWRIPFSRQDRSRFEYWKRMEFTPSQWRELRDHANDRQVGFMVSPFSLEAIDLAESLDPDFWKVASGEVSNLPLLRRLAADGRPVIVSSGMSTRVELGRAIEVLSLASSEVLIAQCTSLYPCPPEKLGLGLIPDLKREFGLRVGLSDHSGEVSAGIAAVALGSSFVESHVTFSTRCFGPDVSSSLTIEEFASLVRGMNFVATSMSAEFEKERIEPAILEMRKLFTRSVVAKVDIAEGEVIAVEDLALLKPGTGLPPSSLDSIVGRRSTRQIVAGEMLKDGDWRAYGA